MGRFLKEQLRWGGREGNSRILGRDLEFKKVEEAESYQVAVSLSGVDESRQKKERNTFHKKDSAYMVR